MQLRKPVDKKECTERKPVDEHLCQTGFWVHIHWKQMPWKVLSPAMQMQHLIACDLTMFMKTVQQVDHPSELSQLRKPCPTLWCTQRMHCEKSIRYVSACVKLAVGAQNYITMYLTLSWCKFPLEIENIQWKPRLPATFLLQDVKKKLTHKNEGVDVCHHLKRNTKNSCALRSCVQLIHTDPYQQQCKCLPLKAHHKNKNINPT